MGSLYLSRDQKEWFTKGPQGLKDNSIVTLLFLAAAAGQKEWASNISIPVLAETAGYDPRHMYNGFLDLESKGYVTGNGDDYKITYHELRFKKGGNGAFAVPEVLLTKRFTTGTTLRGKRFTLWVLSFGIADVTNKRFLKNGLQVTKDKLIHVTGAICPDILETILKQVEWLFEIEDMGDRYRIKVREKYMVYPEKKPFADYIDLASLKIMVSRYNHIKNKAISAWKDLLWLWTTYGSSLLHQALTEANKRSEEIVSLGAYLHGVIKNLLSNENLKFSNVNY